MGCSISSSDRVEPIENHEFQPFQDPSVPETDENFTHSSKNRSCTDVFFLILMISFFLVLGFFMLYCVFHGNIYRVLYGYDNCANVCGMQNYMVKNDPRFECKGKDRKNEKFLLTIKSANGSDYFDQICVKNCSEHGDYRHMFNRCIPKKMTSNVGSIISKFGYPNFFQEATDDLLLTWREILYLCIIGFVVSVILVFLLRFCVGLLVWIVLIGVTLFSLVGTAFLWYLYQQNSDTANIETSYLGINVTNRKKTYYLSFAIGATVVTFCIIVIIIALRKRIKLTVQLFIEAGKSITAMPLILFEPILTLAWLLVTISCWFYFCLWIQSAGVLTYVRENYFVYLPDTVMKIAGFWNLFSMLWMCQFIIGCQHMVLGGAIATWYFSRNKKNIGNPILYSFYNLIKYHLGSVCLGSLLIAIVKLFRLMMSVLEKYLKNKPGKCEKCILYCCQCCLYCFENLLKYITRNAYIEIAMYGKNFCYSGKQAFKLLVNNSLRVTVINSVGDFVLILTKVLVVVATITIGVYMLESKDGLHHVWIPLILVGTFTYFVAHCFITVYEMAIDTIFLCFCEDCEQNDGISRPYYMSRSLMNFVENSRKALYSHSNSDIHDKPPTTISDKV